MSDKKAEAEQPGPALKSYTGHLLKASRVAEVLGVDPATIRRWCDEGVFEVIRIGPPGKRQVVRIKGRSLDAILHPDEQANFLRSEIDLRIP